MTRDFQIPGQALVQVKGPQNSSISVLTQLGLSDAQIQVTLDFKHEDIPVNAWGGQIPPEVQFMLAGANIGMTLVHFDGPVLKECLRLSMAGGGGPGTADGVMPGAGYRMGNNLPRFGVSTVPGSNIANNFIGLNITTPIGPDTNWRFLFAYLYGPPITYPLGTERSVVQLNWRAILYTQDPWQGGAGSAAQVLYDHLIDT